MASEAERLACNSMLAPTGAEEVIGCNGASRRKDRNMEGTRRSELPLVKAREFDRLAVSPQKYD
jgi:hypothetical protein